MAVAQTRQEPDGLPDDAAGKLIIISGVFGFVVIFVFGIVVAVKGDFDMLWEAPNSLVRAIAAGGFEVIWLVPYFYAMQRADASIDHSHWYPTSNAANAGST